MNPNTVPLASKIRPLSLSDYVGQEHLIGEGKPLKLAIENKLVMSFMLWGRPGTGKTTIARIYANAIDAHFFELSAVSAGKDDIRQIVNKNFDDDKPVVLFLDEIHRFNKAQQDYLLPFVENGKLVLIGATTENPSFEIIAPLLSRCRVFVLKELSPEDLLKIINRAMSLYSTSSSKPSTSNKQDPKISEAITWLSQFANGDARQALGVIESTIQLYGSISIENFKNAIQNKFLRFDKKGEEHFDTTSAFIKSMRASNTDAALYYLARMVESGEDPKFIARRMVVFASEDIGLAVPTALVVANEVFRAVDTIGLPEAQINLAHGVAYLCNCAKNRSAYDAYFAALEDVKKYGNLPIPMNLRNAPTKLMKELNYGKGYEMYSKESLLPDQLKNKQYLTKDRS